MEKKYKAQRNSFVFYRSFKESIGDLPDSEKLQMYEAICDYALDFVEPTLTGISKALFTLIRPNIDANLQRWRNGCKGGCPKGTKKPSMKGNKNAEKPKQNQIKTKTKPDVDEDVDENVDVDENKDNIIAASDDAKNNQFSIALREQFSTLAKFKQPLTEVEYKRLCERHGKEAVDAKMVALDNSVGAEKKYNSVYRTLLVWMRK